MGRYKPFKECHLPNDIKKAAIALIISCISTLIAVYFDGLKIDDYGYSDPITLAFNFIWTFIIAWIIWDLFKGKNIKPTLIAVGVVMVFSLYWDFDEFGYNAAQIFYLIELLMFVVAGFFIQTKQSQSWYKESGL
jgi:hypothetical protein